MLHHTPGSSPIAFGDCKLTAIAPARTCIDIKFNSKKDLDDFIASLIILRDSTDTDHSHLQDYDILEPSSIAATEVVFHLSDSCFDSTRDELIRNSERKIAKMQTEQDSAANP